MGSTATATARCISLFPLSLLRRHPSSLRLITTLRHRHHHHDHSLSLSTTTTIKPWPERAHLLYHASRSGHHSITGPNGLFHQYGFVDTLELDAEFLQHAVGCLSFAQNNPTLLWSLPREDVEVVVDGGSPSLFKDAGGVTARMKSFLGGRKYEVSESDAPSTVDLMKFLLSYARMAVVSSENTPISSKVESSVRKLLSELSKSGGISAESVMLVEKQFPETYGRAPGSFGQNIEMKRGDWICQRCTFMNFAKNPECLQCKEPRPMKCLTGEEWDCPQCNFFNFGRNVVCLRCDCKKPALNPSYVEGPTERGLAETEVKQQQCFTKTSELEKSSDTSSDVADEDFPGISRIRNLDSGRNSDSHDPQTPDVQTNIKLEISQCVDQFLGADFDENSSSSDSPEYGQMGEGKSEGAEESKGWFKKVMDLLDEDHPNPISDEEIPETMPMRKGENRFVVSKKKDRSLTSPMYKRRTAMEQTGDNKYVPFVPFPPGYFSRDKPEEKGSDTTSIANQHSGAMTSSSGGAQEITEGTPSKTVYNAPNDTDQTPKSSDFQHTRSSPDKYSETRFTSGTHSHSSSSHSMSTASQLVYNAANNLDQNMKSSGSQFSSVYADGYSETEVTTKTRFQSASSSQSASNVNLPPTDERTGPNSFHNAPNNVEQTLRSSDSQSSANQSIRDVWRGRSLEGSAVKEPDPLDMSEEAKAERWFRRVAQIKDISELSQIPDEDFPSIMPMRKGVNRFVVSKRKTPLERRLTSSQYRRNLPVVRSEPVNKENDSS